MGSVAYFSIGLLQILISVINIYALIVIIAVIMGMLINFRVLDISNAFVYRVNEILLRLTEPVLNKIRRYVPLFGGLDLSPIVLLIGLQIIELFIGSIIHGIASA